MHRFRPAAISFERLCTANVLSTTVPMRSACVLKAARLDACSETPKKRRRKTDLSTAKNLPLYVCANFGREVAVGNKTFDQIDAACRAISTNTKRSNCTCTPYDRDHDYLPSIDLVVANFLAETQKRAIPGKHE